MKKVLLLTTVIALVNTMNVFSQSEPEHKEYPKVVGYMSFIVPVFVYNKDSTTTNFSKSSSIGFPVGINILYSETFGFSFELSPTINTQNGLSKVSNLLIDPGLLFRQKHGWVIVGRLAFETSGRYGVTPLVTKVIDGGKTVNYFISASVPMRTGNNGDFSVGGSLQFGIIFK